MRYGTATRTTKSTIHTDLKKNNASYSIVSNEEIIPNRLPDTYSIFSYEIYAILDLIEKLLNRPPVPEIVIYSDSKSVIEAIENHFTIDPIIQQIHAS